MPFAAFGPLRILIAAAIILLVPNFDSATLSRGFFEFFLIGRIPLTETIISFEAVFAGIVFTSWAIVTYNFTLSGLSILTNELKPISNEDFDEIAL